MTAILKKLPHDLPALLAALILVGLGLGLIYLVVMERMSALAALATLGAVGAGVVLAAVAGRRGQ